MQCLLYYFAAKKQYKNVQSVLTTFIYTTEKKPFTVVLIESDIERLMERIRLRFRSIKDNNDPQRNKGWWCKHICSYGAKSGICDKVWKEKNSMGIGFIKDFYYELNESDR